MDNKGTDRIDRYVYQVVRQLPGKTRGDIEKELRTLISDMLEARCGEREPALEDVDAVLLELGEPDILAAQYSGKNRYLIGPTLFPRYWSMLKLVMICVVGAVSISVLLSVVATAASSPIASEEAIGSFIGNLIGEWIGTIFSAAFSAFAFVTILFACIENRNFFALNHKTGEGMDAVAATLEGKQAKNNFLDKLPPVPVKEAHISRVGSAFAIFFSLLFMILFLTMPQWFAVVLSTAEQPFKVIHIFNLDGIKQYWFWIALSFILGMIPTFMNLIEGRYTKRLALAHVLCQVPSVAIIIYLITQPAIFNQNFFAELRTAIPELSLSLTSFENGAPHVVVIFIAILVVATLLDLGTTVYKAYKYDA